MGRHRPEDVADQRRLRQPRRGARPHRPRRERQPLQEHDDLPRRQGGRLRRDRAGHHGARQDREDGLQGRRHDRAHPRGAPHDRRAGAGRGPRQGLLPDDGRRRGRPRQRGRPGVRPVTTRLRARDRLQPTARDLRQEDRRAPGHPLPARRHGDQGRGQPPDDGHGRAPEGRRAAQRPRGRDGEVPRRGELRRRRRAVVPDPRRVRLLQGVRDRAPLPRGADAAHRRGHGRDPEDDHRPPPPRGLQGPLPRRECGGGRQGDRLRTHAGCRAPRVSRWGPPAGRGTARRCATLRRGTPWRSALRRTGSATARNPSR